MPIAIRQNMIKIKDPDSGDYIGIDAVQTGGASPGAGDVSDVQINGTSILNNHVANIPAASGNALGVVKVGAGLQMDGTSHALGIDAATAAQAKAGTANNPVTPGVQEYAAFYGLAKAAGDTTQSGSSNSLGAYTENAKSKISDSTPSITAKPGVRYICGECGTLAVTAPASGCVDVIFKSGSTPTALTVSSAKTGVTAIKWPAWFDPADLEADCAYEINILDGEYGVVTLWA